MLILLLTPFLLLMGADLHAKVADYNFQENHFQIELTGEENVNPILRHHYSLKSTQLITVDFKTQIIASPEEIRTVFGIPLEVRFNRGNRTGVNILLERGPREEKMGSNIKSNLNWYFQTMVSSAFGLNCNLQLSQFSLKENSQGGIGISYQLNKKVHLTYGVTTPLPTQAGRNFHLLGAVISL
jgi:hypothetical protein